MPDADRNAQNAPQRYSFSKCLRGCTDYTVSRSLLTVSDKELHRYLVQVALDPGFRRRAAENPLDAMRDFALTDADREALLAQDGRMLELLGRALRASGDFPREDPSDGPPPPETTVDLREIPLPPIALTLRLRPYARCDAEGRLVVHYAANVLPAEAPESEPRPPDMEGEPLEPLDLCVRVEVTGLANAEGALAVRYDAQAEHTLPLPTPTGNNEPETPPDRPARGARQAPNPWAHRCGAPDVTAAAAAVQAAEGCERDARLEELVRALTEGAPCAPAPPPPTLPGAPDIFVVGLGITAGVHLTDETREALGRVHEVLFVDNGAGTREVLARYCPRVRSLFAESYVEADSRLTAYHRMAISVVGTAMDHAPIAFAMQGHPLVGAYAPVLIHDLAATLGLRTVVLPGLCHLDALFAELLFDPFAQGLQAYEATDLLLRRRPLRPDVPALLFQVGNVETRLYTERVSRPDRMHRLLAHLEHFYPPEHRVQALYASPHPSMPTTCYTFVLSRLPEYAPVLHPGFTLFIPAVGERPIVDPVLAAQVDSPEHLRSITR